MRGPRPFFRGLAEQLLGFARHHFRLSREDASGVSLRAHLNQVAKATGEAPAELVGEYALPEALAHVWAWFCELSNARAPGAFALAPISYQDVDAWARLTGHQPTPSEVALLRQLDDAFREAMQTK